MVSVSSEVINQCFAAVTALGIMYAVMVATGRL